MSDENTMDDRGVISYCAKIKHWNRDKITKKEAEVIQKFVTLLMDKRTPQMDDSHWKLRG